MPPRDDGALQGKLHHTVSPAKGGYVTKRWVLTGLLLFFLLGTATKGAAAEFTYRGVKFSMTRGEVSILVLPEPGTNQVAGWQGFSKNAAFQFTDKG